MKRIASLALILCCASMAWSQGRSAGRHLSKYPVPHPLRQNRLAQSSAAMSNSTLSPQPAAAARKSRSWGLGTYPNGTWAQLMDVNGWGVAVGLGDTGNGYDQTLDPPRGYTRPIGIPLFGRDAMKWFDLGTFGGESYENTYQTALTACMGIADTGMIVGLAPTTGDPVTKAVKYDRAFAWTPESGLVDLGALEKRGFHNSNAIGVNKLGTLIVGWSGPTVDFTVPPLPVVWTPSIFGKEGRQVTSWKIHELDTKGFEQFPYWVAETANVSGQIVGFAFDDSGAQIAVLWNPLPHGLGWKAMQLPASSEYPDYINTWAGGINEKGEIVGTITNADYSSDLPALWRPADHQRQHYKVTVLRTLSGLPGSYGDPAAINDLGDIVGTTYDPPDYNSVPTLWSAGNPDFVQALDFQGYFGVANKVNDFRIVVGGYWSDSCPQGCAAATQIR